MLKVDACHYHHIHIKPVHMILAQACLCVLLYINWQTTKNLAMADYAAKHLQNHAEFGNVLSYIQDGIYNLLDADKYHFVAWLWACRIISQDESSIASSLYYVVMFGFCGLVQHLILRHPVSQGGLHEGKRTAEGEE